MRERGIGDGMGQQEGVEKENKTLGTERFENIKDLYVNKKSLIKTSNPDTEI